MHQGRIRGSAAQLGGVLVIAPDSSVRYVHLSEDSSDNPPVKEVLAAAKAIRPHLERASAAELRGLPCPASDIRPYRKEAAMLNRLLQFAALKRLYDSWRARRTGRY